MKNMMRREQGLTMISLALILGLIASIVLLALKIGPIYLDHSKVINALAAVEETTDIETKSKSEILSSLKKRFNFNYVYHIEDDDITVIKQGNYLKVDIEYEVVETIVGNLSVLVEFHEGFEVGET
jgi:Tfp pilus assembly major pilin PilA